MASWTRGTWNGILSIILCLSLLGALGTLGYVLTTSKAGERFTEFYILGPEGKAEHYPKVLKVGEQGKVILGIVNHEHERANYQIQVTIDGETTGLRIGDEERDIIEVELGHEEKWEREIDFVPRKSGKAQKVEFMLYKEGKLYFKDPPHLWIDVEQARS